MIPRTPVLPQARSLPEWVGANPDTPVPNRVRLRVFEKDGKRCQCGCTRLITPGVKWNTDHRIAIINGGENRESNLCTLIEGDHIIKNAEDVAEKSRMYVKRAKFAGLDICKGRKLPGGRHDNIRKKIIGVVVDRKTEAPFPPLRGTS